LATSQRRLDPIVKSPFCPVRSIRFLVRLHDRILELLAEATGDRMNDILELPVGQLSGGHRDEVTILPFNDLDVVNHKLVVEGNRYIRLQLAALLHFANSNF